MRSLVEELKADTTAIATLNQHRNDRLLMYDSLIKALIERKYSGNEASFYYWGRNISRRVFFFSADGTMQQLKNSGGLRLINSPNISDKIIAYDVLYRNIIFQQELEEVHLNEYRALASRIFDAGVFNKMMKGIRIVRPKGNPGNSLFLSFEKPEVNSPLIDNSPYLLNELANKLNYYAAGSLRLLQLLEQLEEMAASMIESIKKEYRLK